MSSFLNNPQMSALPRGAGALQQRPVNPQQPGPAETTRPPILNLPSPDTLRQLLRNDKSTPFCQFPDQAAREREKLKRQRSCMRGGRRQTLPWDDSLDLWDNSYNNVRGRWIEQGIWREEWDQVWVKEREAEEWLEGTFPRFRKPEASRSKPGCCWGHEDVGPGPDSAPELGPKPCPTFINFGIHLDASGPTELPRRPIEIMQKRLGSSPNYLVPYPTARSSEASRPYRQFLYQTGKEREWIKDEVDYQAPGADFDPDAMAYETVKYNWIEDGIWRPAWEELPGRTWLHEDPLEGEEAVKVPSDSGRSLRWRVMGF
ncbi:hypothetical protein N0V84_011481 [Fusarium piperis]|uniref:Uncharacterized protein n=1 Tax=Fusarium piperis TaxID=1435070 RepID=A0A9W8W4A5_9HYPO|nr:hypothetical protein N0V84_011481 [Fusarium piperis]